MTEKIIIAGSGGQGVMLLGKVLATSAMEEGKYVTWFPSYGAEVRGGTAYCMVVVSDNPIGSPYIEKADTLIIMNKPSMVKFKDRIKRNGLWLFNSSLAEAHKISGLKIFGYPFTDIASSLGNTKVANMVALGSYLARKETAQIKNVLRVIEEMAPADKKNLVAINREALNRGAELTK